MTEPTPPPSDETEREPLYRSVYEDVGDELTPEDVAALTPDDIEDVDPADIITLDDGRILRRVTGGMAATVTFTDKETGETRRIVVPGDPETMTNEEVTESAWAFYQDVALFQSSADPETLESFLNSLEEAKHFQTLADIVTQAVRDGFKLSLSGGPIEGLDIPPEHYETAAQEATKLLREEVGTIVNELFLTGDSGEAFKAQYARDVMATAWAWAVEDARAGIEGLREEGALTAEAETDEAFHELIGTLFREGTYLQRAILTLSDVTVRDMVQLVADTLDKLPEEHSDSLHKIVSTAWQRYTESLPSPAVLPGFLDGWGTVPNSKEARASILAIQGGADGKWQDNPANGYPWFSTPALPALSFLLSPDDYQTADAAWQAVLSLDDETADTFMIACAQYAANLAHTRGGLVLITPDDVLAQRGIAKHKRSYKPSDREKAARDIMRLGTIAVEGYRDGYEGAGRKRKRVRVTLEGRLLEISVKARQQALSGDLTPPPATGTPLGFWYRLGPWAQGFLGADRSEQFAEMNQTILKYHAKNHRYQKRIGRYLVWIFRIQRGGQSFQVRTLLEQSGITLTPGDYKNPARTRARIEKALEDLKRDGIIGSLEWDETPALSGQKTLDELLCWTVRITPPTPLLERYQKIGKPRLRALPGKKASA